MDLNAKARLLPKQPGVYIMRDRSGGVIYVGKAKALKNRVVQYFQKNAEHTPKTANMVKAACDFDIIVTKSEFEALLLECSLIKEYKPKYNILLKDDKGYPFIRLTVREAYPRLSVASKKTDDGAKYFGPYGGRFAARDAIQAVSEALGLPTCKRVFPRDIGKTRPCLNLHLKKCIAPCAGGISADEYKKRISDAVLLLEGKSAALMDIMKAEMNRASDALEFEKAAGLRDRMAALDRLNRRQSVTAGIFSDLDAVVYAQGQTCAAVVVLHFIRGTLLSKETSFLNGLSTGDGAEAISGFVKQYYSEERAIPDLILLSEEIDDRGQIERLLSDKRGKRIEIAVPQKGKKREIIDIAVSNAADELNRAETREKKAAKSLELLSQITGVPDVERIEAFDVSNTGGRETVAAMVVFEGRGFQKSEYRKFRIKTVEGQNDVASIAEAVERRLANYLGGNEKFKRLPSLMLIDGGAQQAKAAASAISSSGLAIPVFGMVKDEGHRTRALVSENGQEIGIKTLPALFALIGRIQEETHRFAIDFHRTLRGKAGYASGLLGIPGVGELRRNALLCKFRTVKAIRTASSEELSKVVPKDVARAIRDYFDSKE